MNNLRTDFPLIHHSDRVYFDNAATSQKPQCVTDTEKHFYEAQNANVLRGFYPLSVEATELYEQARKTVAGFIGAISEKEIIFTRNATESINLEADSWGLEHLHQGDEIAVSIMEHHSNLLPWQMVAERTGATVNYIECEPDGSFTESELDRAINQHTKLVAVTQISNVLGCVNDISKFAERAKAVGAKLLTDASQSVPHMPVNVQTSGTDFLAFSGHKMLAPMGIGVLWAKKELLETMSPFLRGGEMIENVTKEGAVWAELPHKFEAGTVNAGGAVALASAIRYYQKTGFDTIQKQENQITEYILKHIRKIPYIHVLGSENAENHTGIVSFTIDGVHPHDIAEILSQDGIDIRAGHHCAQPLLAHLNVGSAARASVMFYNTTEEAERFLDSLKTIRRRMGYDKSLL